MPAENSIDCDASNIISRFQRSEPLTGFAWADGPGYYISRRWRSLQSNE
jgi:hypothetical protein